VLSYLDPPLYEPEPIIAIIPATPKNSTQKNHFSHHFKCQLFRTLLNTIQIHQLRKINPDRKLRKSLKLSKN
jgi:hypothetical protein